MTPSQAPVSDADLDAFISFVGGSDIGPLMITALAIAKDAKQTRALLREAKDALEAGANILEQQAIYEKRLDRLNWEQCAAALRKLIEACP